MTDPSLEIAVGVKLTIGLKKTAVQIPRSRMTHEQMADLVGIPAGELLSKIGVLQKPVLGTDENIMEHARAAALQVTEGISPASINLVLFGGMIAPEKCLRHASADIQEFIGAKKAFAFDISHGCNSINTCLQIARNFLLGNAHAETVLIVVADQLSRYVDYRDPQQTCIFSFADAAAATLVVKGCERNQLMSSFSVTEGRFVDDLYLDMNLRKFVLRENELEDRALSAAYERNYPEVIRKALNPINTQEAKCVFMNQGSPSLIDKVEKKLEIQPGRVFRSFQDHGHMGNADVLFGLTQAFQSEKIVAGDIVALASSGVGYSWSSTALRI